MRSPFNDVTETICLPSLSFNSTPIRAMGENQPNEADWTVRLPLKSVVARLRIQAKIGVPATIIGSARRRRPAWPMWKAAATAEVFDSAAWSFSWPSVSTIRDLLVPLWKPLRHLRKSFFLPCTEDSTVFFTRARRSHSKSCGISEGGSGLYLSAADDARSTLRWANFATWWFPATWDLLVRRGFASKMGRLVGNLHKQGRIYPFPLE